MPRDGVLEMLCSKLSADAAASNLYKATSYPRNALVDHGAVVDGSQAVPQMPIDVRSLGPDF